MFKKNIFKNKKITLMLFLGILTFFLFGFNFAQAQIDTSLQYGTITGLTSMDIRVIVARIIQVFLGLIGLITLSLVVYAGFLWMTAGGDATQVEKAKSILKNGLIGLALILMSFSIVTFIIGQLLVSLGYITFPPENPLLTGQSALGRGIIEYHYPERDQKDVARNTNIVITFREAIDPKTLIIPNGVCSDPIYSDENLCTDNGGIWTADNVLNAEGILIYESSLGEEKPYTGKVNANTVDNLTFVFNPKEYLGSVSDEIKYTIKLTQKIKKANGSDAFPLNPYYWEFIVGTTIDLTPPHISSVFPDVLSFDSYTCRTESLELGSISPSCVDYQYARNALIQVNFNEAVNPLSVAGFLSGLQVYGVPINKGDALSYDQEGNPDLVASSGENICNKNICPSENNKYQACLINCLNSGKEESVCTSFVCLAEKNILASCQATTDYTACLANSSKLTVYNYDNQKHPLILDPAYKLEGEWVISNKYQTVEFRSDYKCGINSCGETVYCLPGEKIIVVVAKAATPDDLDGLSVEAIQAISTTEWENKYSPMVSFGNQGYGGVVDICDNALDSALYGKNPAAKLPNFYAEASNSRAEGSEIDSVNWNFDTSNTIDLSSPKVQDLFPPKKASYVNLSQEFKSTFSKILMGSSINGESIPVYSDIDLDSLNTKVANGDLEDQDDTLARWFGFSNIDFDNNGVDDYSLVNIYHSQLTRDPSTIYNPILTKNIKDVYQNCFTGEESSSLNSEKNQEIKLINLKGFSFNEAKEYLFYKGLTIKTPLTFQSSTDKYFFGTVINQTPSAGSMVSGGNSFSPSAEVSLVLFNKYPPTPVPTSLVCDQTTCSVKNSNNSWICQCQYDEEGQFTGANWANRPVPDVLGFSEKLAQDIVKSFGLKVSGSSLGVTDSRLIGLVIDEKPSIDSYVTVGSTINLIKGVSCADQKNSCSNICKTKEQSLSDCVKLCTKNENKNSTECEKTTCQTEKNNYTDCSNQCLGECSSF